MSVSSQKQLLRTQFRDKRRSVLRADAVRAEAALVNEWCQHAFRASRIALYVPRDGEISCDLLLHELRKAGHTTVFPQTEHGELVFGADIELVVVPGVVFDPNGYRIGFGKGFYDRFLKTFTGISVGVGYEFQVIERVPREAWDIPVDWLITEQRSYACKRLRSS